MFMLGESEMVSAGIAFAQFGLAGWFAWLFWQERGKRDELTELLKKSVETHETTIAMFDKFVDVVNNNTSAISALKSEISAVLRMTEGIR